MTKPFKPLLSATIEDTSKIKYPVAVSCKLDGVRCMVIDGVAMSRSLKPIPNAYVQELIGKPEYNGLDGELIVGDPFAPDCYRATASGVMSRDGEPDFTFQVFDRIDMPEAPFMERYAALLGVVTPLTTIFDPSIVKIVPHRTVYDEAGLLEVEARLLARGAEGVMVRSLDGKYKYGRSTLKDGILGKLKRFADSESHVLAVIEKMHNANVATTNALGHTERSSHKENLVPTGTMGALSVEDIHTGVRFEIGTGFSDADRAWWWDQRDALDGLIVKYKHFAVGAYEKPRFPSFVGMRSLEDM